MTSRILLFLSFLLVYNIHLFAQCEVTASVSPTTIVCGDYAELTVFGQGQGQQVFNETFNSGAPTGWAFTQQATYTNPCSPAGVDGTTHIWMGNQSAVPRALETQPYNFVTATSGATICFDMLFAEQGNSAPCEGPDEPDEGVFLQYSIDGGNTWVTIHYFDPNGGNDPQLTNWNNWCFQLPAAAVTTATQIRWFQDADSGADYDHWGIDNVEIYYNDPTYNITWTHDNYSYGQGSSGGTSPNKVNPHSTTSYYVEMTNGSSTCRDTVTLTVVNPTIEIDAGNDTTICAGTCATLNATAKVIKSAEKTVTYANNEFQILEPGSPAEININVTGLSNPTINPVVIQSVCIGRIDYTGFGIVPPFTPTNFTIRDLRFELICPDGTVLVLLPQNVVSTTNTITNLCFVPAGPTITTGSGQYSGSFAPNQPFTNLNGCTSNGVYTLRVRLTPPIAFGLGTFFNWNITFLDPEISYPADISWSPTTNMTGANTLTPQVCPTATTTYTLTASDTAGCVTVTDQVTVTVQPSCCNLLFTGTHADPSCGASDGSINITVTQGTGPYTYAWSDGPATTANRTNLPAGIYTVSITDNGQPNCVKDTTITLVSPNSPVINSITPTAETCDGYNDGSISVSASGGTGTLTYTWTPANSGANINNLADGNYTVTVTDANGCTSTGNTTVAAGPPCFVLAIAAASTNPTCGAADGSITVTVTTGSGNYTYAWSGGGSTTNTLSNVGSGTYTVTVTDITQGCDHDTTITLNSANGPTISNTATTDETCAGAADGTATVTASGGTGALTYNWNTTPVQSTASVSSLPVGCYSVTVTDAAGCSAYDQICIAAGPNCCNLSYDITTTDPTCGNTDGSIAITNLGGSGNYGFLWSDASTGQDLLNVGAGSYSVTITDNGFPNCQLDTTVSLSNPNAPVIDNITATNETCLGAADGTATVSASGGTGALTYSWNTAPVQTTASVSGLVPGCYFVTVTDAAGCSEIGQVCIVAGPNCCNLAFDLDIVDPSCGQNNGSIEVTNITGATTMITFDWSNGLNTQIISGLAAGTYTVTVIDNGQSNCQMDSTVTISDVGGATLAATVTDETCAGAADGTANVVATGGVAPLTYTWSNAATGSAITGLAPGNYTVSVEDANGCISTAQVTVNAGGQCCSLTASATSTPASCGANDGTITITVDPASGIAPYEYNLNGGAFGASNVFTVGGGNYSVIARDANGCDTTLQVTVTEANNTIILTVSSSDPTCPGGTDGWVGVDVAGGTPPNITSWSTGVSTDTVLNLGAGTYSLTVTDQTNCSAFAQVTLTDPAPTSVSLGPDVDLCYGESVNLDAGLAGSYIWSTGDTTQSIIADTSGTYAVTITNAGGCNASDDIVVSVTPPFTVDAGEDTTIIQYESVLELNATVTGSAGGSYLWTPSDYLACDDCATTMLSPDSTTTYVLTYTDALGCVASDSVTITVLPGEYFAIVPNAFSPNADGANDILYVYYKGVRRLVFRIHNRWGEKVFETDDMTQGWDGTFKGVKAQDGVYVWDLYVEFYNVKLPIQRSKGSVLLLK